MTTAMSQSDVKMNWRKQPVALNATPVSCTAKDRNYGVLHTPAIPNKSLKALRPFRIFLRPSLVLTTTTV